MLASRRIAVVLLAAIAVAGTIAWVTRGVARDEPTRIADGTRVRAEDPSRPAADGPRTSPGAELIGAPTRSNERNRGPRRTLVVVVEGPSGPIASAEVAVEPDTPFVMPERSIEAPSPEPDRHESGAQVASTDATGRVSFVLFTDASASIDVSATGFMRRTTTHWFADEAVAGAIETEHVRLEPGAMIEGRVVDAKDGAAIRGVEIRADGPGGDLGAVSDESGSFRLWVDMSTQGVQLDATANGFVDASIDVRMWNGIADPPSIVLRLRRPAPRGTLEVLVRDAAGRPIEHAAVSLAIADDASARDGSGVDGGLEDTSEWNVSGRTDAEGRFVASEVPIGRGIEVTARKSGRARSRSPESIHLSPGDPNRRVELTLGDLGSLVLTVLDWDGKPASGDVHLIGAFELRSPIGIGRFRIPELEPGPIDVTAHVEGQVPSTGSTEIRAGVEATLTIRLGKGVAIRGTVVDAEGRPIPWASVAATREAPDADGVEVVREHRQRADDLGRFALEGIAVGPYRLRVSGESDRDDEWVGFAALVVVTAPCDDVRIVARRLGGVTARLLRPDGTPCEGVLAEIIPKQSRSVGESDENGVISFHGVEDGDSELVADVAGYAPLRVRIAMRGGASLDLGVLRLDAGSTLRGRVLDAGDRPVDSARVTVGNATVVTPEDGTFEFEHLSKGRHDVRATADGFVQTGTTAEAPTHDALVVRLTRGGVVRGAIREPVDSGRVGGWRFVPEGAARESDGEALDDPPGSIVVRPSPDGRYLLALAPGRWTAEWKVEEAAPVVVATFAIEEGAVRDLDLELPKK